MHALIRLREELRALEEDALRIVSADEPIDERAALLRHTRSAVAQIKAAIRVLEVAQARSEERREKVIVPANWDRALIEPWAERKARLAAERRSA